VVSERSDRRNPYLVLGVDYGARHEEVTAAYTRRSRVARADNGYPYSIDDLVWALDEIEGLNGAGQAGPGTGAQSAAVTFRVPADPSAYEPPPGPGLLRPEPVPMRRRTRPAARTEVAGLVASARRDATAYALERLADQVERTLVSPAGRVRLSVPDPPRQPRSRGPILIILSILVLVAVGVVVLLAGRGDDQPVATTTVAPTTTQFVVVTTPPVEGFDTPVDSNGLSLTPTEPLLAYGLVCVVWQVAGTPPLTFDATVATLVVNGQELPDSGIPTGRVPVEAIDPDATSGAAETCFNMNGMATTGVQAELRYTPAGLSGTSPYRWLVVLP
jgi:hypothetical protein